ncbi:MAG: protein kinase, partial [Myxococcales bacterium]|nr:protein kinase [Myxococcales bacterium]
TPGGLAYTARAMSPPPHAEPDPLIGVLVAGRYRLTGVIGRGGFSTVYAAEDERLRGQRAAVKVLLPFEANRDGRARFDRERRIISMLRGPHVVQTLESGQLPDGRPFLVMELLEGAPLADVMRARGRLSPRRAVRIADGILDALVEAHAAGVVHRDLKPGNVFLVERPDEPMCPKVLDFGIASIVEGDDEQAVREHAVGTPRYMAPEQFRGEVLDHRGDLYALGVLLHLMTSGRPPFIESDPVPAEVERLPSHARVVWQHLHQQPPPVRVGSGALADLIVRLLGKRPEYRYPDASAVRAALRTLPEADGVLGPVGQPAPAAPPDIDALEDPAASIEVDAPGAGRRSVALFVTLGLAFVGGVAIAGWLAMREDRVPNASAPIGASESPPLRADAGVQCRHRIETMPPGAKVSHADRTLGFTPSVVDRPCGQPWPLTVQLPGFATETVTLEGEDAAPVPLIQKPGQRPPAGAGGWPGERACRRPPPAAPGRGGVPAPDPPAAHGGPRACPPSRRPAMLDRPLRSDPRGP